MNRVDGTRGTVHTGHLRSPGTGSLDTPATYVTEHIQHTLARRIGLQPLPVHAVIIEPSRFLPPFHGHLESHAILLNRQEINLRAMGLLNVSIQPFYLPHLAVVLEDNRPRMRQPLHRTNNRLLHLLHAGRGNLNHHHIIKPVNHQPGKPVTVAKHPAIKRLVKQPLPQSQRRLHPLGKPLRRHAMSGIPADQTAADQRMRIHKHRAHGFIVGRAQFSLGSGFKLGQRGAMGIHFIAVDPKMTSPEPALCAFAEV